MKVTVGWFALELAGRKTFQRVATSNTQHVLAYHAPITHWQEVM